MRSKNKGFTLLELLVTIAIIGILATIIMASLSTAKAKGRDARRAADIKQIQQAVENYFENNSAYPADIASLSTYLTSVPQDPSGGSYGYSTSNNIYCIGTNFEQGTPKNMPPNANCTIYTGGSDCDILVTKANEGFKSLFIKTAFARIIEPPPPPPGGCTPTVGSYNYTIQGP